MRRTRDAGRSRAIVRELNDRYVITPNDMIQTMCQEVGHDLGLGHQNPPTSGSCMEQGSLWLTPNAHDYDQLAAIHRHSDGYRTTMGAPGSFLPLLDEEIAVEAQAIETGCIQIISWADGSETTQELPISAC
ncbi:MAG: hypothetical protein M3323_10065 [Actinomycetota bacterium]|nr:hypothetical protein [Actinomycetota bacterium]